MDKIAAHYKSSHTAAFYRSMAFGLLLLAISLLINYFANLYTISQATGVTELHDILLDHLPLINVDDIFFEGILLFIGVVALLGFQKPSRFPMLLNASALFIIIRSFFIILTHLAPPLHGSYVLTNTALERAIAGSGDDLFFSGHTGFPFLMALLFWENINLRLIFIAISIIFGVSVLLGHLHYSIDVFAAFFITYGIYNMAKRIFKKDYEKFHEKIQERI